MELKINHLSKRYGNKLALDDFSYSFTAGIYGILGANGAGKSTLMNLITDNVRRDQGEILWDGREILKLGASFRALLGYMPQEQGMYPDFSAREFLLYMAALKGLPRKSADAQIRELLSLFGLEEASHRRLGGFSGGMKQRVLLCQALLGDPRAPLVAGRVQLFTQQPGSCFPVSRRFLHGDFLGIVDGRCRAGKQGEQFLLGLFNEPADAALQLADGRPGCPSAFSGNQGHHGFRLAQVDAPVQERPAGKFPRLGFPDA